MATRLPTAAERALWVAFRTRMEATADPCDLLEVDILNNIGASLQGAYLPKGSWTAADPQPLQRAQLLNRIMILDVDWTTKADLGYMPVKTSEKLIASITSIVSMDT